MKNNNRHNDRNKRSQCNQPKPVVQTHSGVKSSPPEQQLSRKLIENLSLYRLSNEEWERLVNECRIGIDVPFFRWMDERKLKLTKRDIIYCVLVRMNKSKTEIVTILAINEGGYRTLKSRLKERISECTERDLNIFLRKLNA